MKKLLTLALCAALSSTAFAGEKEIRTQLMKQFPDITKVDKVSKTQYLGLYEAVLNDQQLIYTNEDGTLLFDGSIIETNGKENITEERRKKLFAIKFNELPFELATKKVVGSGKHKLAQFTDPRCGYCKKLEQELAQLKDYTLYSFIIPLQPGSEEISRNVMCAKNPVQVWDDYMLRNKKPAEAKCDFDFNKTKALASKYRINGTPGIIFSDGTINPGYMPAAPLQKRLEETAKTK